MRTTRIVSAALASMMLAGSVAASDRAVRTEANRVFRQGTRLIRQERYNEALARFERVLAYRARPNVMWNIAACHVYLGQRDLSLWFMERYLAEVQASRDSLEMQQALTAFAASDQYIRGLEERERLWDLVSDADDLASDGDATPAEGSQLVYGTGASSPPAAARLEVARAHGTELFRIGLQQISEGNWEGGKTFFERSLAYRMLRNAAYNIATIHLSYGRRDLAVHFYRLYIANRPEVQGDAGVAEALQAIEDSSPRVGDEQRRAELSDQMADAIDRALGVSPTPAAAPAGGPTTAPE